MDNYLHKSAKMKSKTRKLINHKSDQKAEAIALWKSGKKITDISRVLKVSRHSVYRWIGLAETQLKRKKRKKSYNADSSLIVAAVELVVLMRGPSMKVLSKTLDSYFGIIIHPAKLRRILIDKCLYPYKPSAQYASIELIYKNK